MRGWSDPRGDWGCPGARHMNSKEEGLRGLVLKFLVGEQVFWVVRVSGSRGRTLASWKCP